MLKDDLERRIMMGMITEHSNGVTGGKDMMLTKTK